MAESTALAVLEGMNARCHVAESFTLKQGTFMPSEKLCGHLANPSLLR